MTQQAETEHANAHSTGGGQWVSINQEWTDAEDATDLPREANNTSMQDEENDETWMLSNM